MARLVLMVVKLGLLTDGFFCDERVVVFLLVFECLVFAVWIFGGDFVVGFVVFTSLFFVFWVFNFIDFLSMNLSVAIDFRLFPRAGSVMSSKGVIDGVAGVCEVTCSAEVFIFDEGLDTGFWMKLFVMRLFGMRLFGMRLFGTRLFGTRLFGMRLYGIELLFMR